MRPVPSLYAVFFAEAYVLGNWIPRIPAIKEDFDLSQTQLGFCLFALAFGTLVAFAGGSGLIRRLGLRDACRWPLVVWALAIAAAPWMANMAMLMVWLIGAGVAIGLVEIAMNTAADGYERTSGKRWMSKCHGFWSIGSLVGAGVGAAFASAGFSVELHFALALLPAIPLILLVTRGVPQSDRAADEVANAPFRLPPASLALLCLMPVGIMLIEGAFIDWSALYVQDVLLGTPFAVGAIYIAFSAVMAATRLAGDGLLDRFGALRVARVSALSAIVGLAIFTAAHSLQVAFVGALFCGLGVAIFYPLTMTVVARRPGDATDNVATISLFCFTSFMLGPPLLGALADAVGLRIALASLLPLAALSLVLTSEIERE